MPTVIVLWQKSEKLQEEVDLLIQMFDDEKEEVQVQTFSWTTGSYWGKNILQNLNIASVCSGRAWSGQSRSRLLFCSDNLSKTTE